MESKDEKVIWLTSIVCAAIVIFSLGLYSLWNGRTKLFVENGYSRQTLQGESDVQWVLSEEK